MLHYRRFDLSPDAEWVVFLHGAGGSSSIWHRQIREFSAHYNVLLVDLRGHGLSKLSEAEAARKLYSFEDVSREALDVLDHLSIEKAHFVGISLGCILIRTIGEMAPERVQTMTLGGAIVRLDLRSRFLVGAGHLFKRFIPFIWLYKLFAWIIMPRRQHRESRLLFVNEAKKLAQREFLRWYKLTAGVNPVLRFFREKELSIPTLYVMGEEDHLFLAPVRQVAAQHASSTLAVVAQSGHVVNVDQPERFNALTLDFLRRHARR